MKKNNKTKSAINLSVNKDILKKFKEETKRRAINKSGLFQNFMEEWLEQNRTDEKRK